MGLDKGFAAMGGDKRSLYIFDKRIQPQHMFVTANSEVIYTVTRLIDVSKGPVAFYVPPRIRGHFIDMGQRAIVDCGDIGPDQGEGGKYLAVSNDYDGEVPDGYFEVRSKYSDQFFLAIRSFPGSEGSVEAAVQLGKTLIWRYLSEADSPPENQVVLIGDRAYSQEWPRDEEVFAWLAEICDNRSIRPIGDRRLNHLGV